MRNTAVTFIFGFIVCAAAVNRPRGVSLEKASFYKNDQDFHCLSGEKALPFDHVNDDYCDCADGSDEPGTSACENGVFYCENKGHKGVYILSSRVNDGICDCCDGSDEFEQIISCPNTCMKQNEAERERLESLRRHQAEGFKVKQEYMQQGKRARDEKLSKVSELEKEKEILTSEKETAEAAKEEAEEPEKAAIEEHKKAFELVKEERKKVEEAAAAAKAFALLDANQDGNVDYPELMKHKEFDIDNDGTVSEEESKEYMEDNEQVDLALFTDKIWPNIKEIFKIEELQSEKPAEEEQKVPEDENAESDQPHDDVVEGGSPEDHGHVADEDGINYSEEEEEEEADDDDDDDDDDGDAAYDISDKKDLHEEAFDDIQKKADSLKENLDLEGQDGNPVDNTEAKLSLVVRDHDPLPDTGNNGTDSHVSDEDKEPEYNEETKRLIAVADETREKFNEADRKLRDNEKEISEIKKYLETDFGPNQEFAALNGQCFEFTDREYTYRLCPFDKSTQKNKNGGMETSLGTWGKWHGPDEDKYVAMKYENGQGCWNGPSRSTQVNLHCGSTNAVTSASEPSRCEYQFEFTTPARCTEPKPLDSQFVHEEL